MNKVTKLLLPIAGASLTIAPVISFSSCAKKTFSYEKILVQNGKKQEFKPSFEPLKPSASIPATVTADEAIKLFFENVKSNPTILAEEIANQYYKTIDQYEVNDECKVNIINIQDGNQPRISFTIERNITSKDQSNVQIVNNRKLELWNMPLRANFTNNKWSISIGAQSKDAIIDLLRMDDWSIKLHEFASQKPTEETTDYLVNNTLSVDEIGNFLSSHIWSNWGMFDFESRLLENIGLKE